MVLKLGEAARPAIPQVPRRADLALSQIHNERVESFISLATGYVGYPAIRPSCEQEAPFERGNNPTAFGCAGLFQFLFLRSGVDIFVESLARNARFAREFFDHIGTHVTPGEQRRGDVVFFSYDGAMPTHMGLYLGDGKVLHKGFIDISLTPAEPTGDYRKRIVVSDLDVLASDRRNAGNPIRYIPDRGPQRYFNNPIGFKRVID